VAHKVLSRRREIPVRPCSLSSPQVIHHRTVSSLSSLHHPTVRSSSSPQIIHHCTASSLSSPQVTDYWTVNIWLCRPQVIQSLYIVAPQVHAFHHNNHRRWSGLAMHPVEHFFYYSCTLLPMVWSLHPFHFWMNKIHADISPLPGHDGHDSPAGGSFFHHIHHAHYEYVAPPLVARSYALLPTHTHTHGRDPLTFVRMSDTTTALRWFLSTSFSARTATAVSGIRASRRTTVSQAKKLTRRNQSRGNRNSPKHMYVQSRSSQQ
jgi:hypothetical protein